MISVMILSVVKLRSPVTVAGPVGVDDRQLAMADLQSVEVPGLQRGSAAAATTTCCIARRLRRIGGATWQSFQEQFTGSTWQVAS